MFLKNTLKSILIKILPKKIINKLKSLRFYLKYLPNNIYINRHFNSNELSNGVKLNISQKKINRWFKLNSHKTTIVIPSYNDFEVLKPCIDSIYKTVDLKKLKIIIVDDYCQESSRKQLQELENKQTRIIYRTKNGGFSKAINTGLKQADQDSDVIILNSDIVCQANWFENLMYGAYKINKNVGICGPKLLYPDQTIQSAGSFRSLYGFEHYFRFEPQDNDLSQIPQYCLAITGACLYIKREVINKIGLLNEEYKFTYEDIDYCLRTWRKNYRVLCFPKSQLIHYEGKTREKHKSTQDNINSSMALFWDKWNSWFNDRQLRDVNNRFKLIFLVNDQKTYKEAINIIKKLKEDEYSSQIWSVKRHFKVKDKIFNLRLFKNYDSLNQELVNQQAVKISLDWKINYCVILASFKTGKAVFLKDHFEKQVEKTDDTSIKTLMLASNRQELINLNLANLNKDFFLSLEKF